MVSSSTRQQILLLVAASSIPLSIGLASVPRVGPMCTGTTLWMPATAATSPSDPSAQTETVSESVEIRIEVEPEPVVGEVIEVTPIPAAGGPTYGRDFLWLAMPAFSEGEADLVLHAAPEDEWAQGEPQTTGSDGGATAAFAEAAAPEALRGWEGRAVDLYTATGWACRATVGTPRLVAEIDGDLELMNEDYDGMDEDEDEDGESYWDLPEDERQAELVGDVWEHGRRLLTAPLTLDAACEGAEGLVWARPVERGPVTFLASRPLSSGALDRASEPYLALEEVRSLSQEFDDHVTYLRREGLSPSDGPAPSLSDRLVGQRWSTAAGVTAFVTVIPEGEEFGPEMCSADPVPVWAVAAVDSQGQPHDMMAPSYSGTPEAIVDVDGDGRFEMLVDAYRPSLLSLEDGHEIASLEPVPFIGCPC